MNIFEQASRVSLRFDTARGVINTEDLWLLPLQTRSGGVSLDSIAQQLHRQLKDAEEISFVAPVPAKDALLQLRFDIVKHVIDARLAEKTIADTARVNAERKQKLLEVLARKQDATLESASEEEIRAMIDAI